MLVLPAGKLGGFGTAKLGSPRGPRDQRLGRKPISVPAGDGA